MCHITCMCIYMLQRLVVQGSRSDRRKVSSAKALQQLIFLLLSMWAAYLCIIATKCVLFFY